MWKKNKLEFGTEVADEMNSGTHQGENGLVKIRGFNIML